MAVARKLLVLVVALLSASRGVRADCASGTRVLRRARAVPPAERLRGRAVYPGPCEANFCCEANICTANVPATVSASTLSGCSVCSSCTYGRR